MKKILILIGLILPVLAVAQSQDQNYIKTIVYNDSTKIPIANPTTAQAKVQVAYFDGLGRTIQTVQYKQSQSEKSIITPVEYDGFGRQVKEYLPYVSSTGLAYDSSGISSDVEFYATPTLLTTGNPYFEGTANPYTEKELESSPLSRTMKQAAPGDDWVMGNGKEVEFEYLANAAHEVRKFKANTDWAGSGGIYDAALYDDGYYSADKLYKTITKDENWISGNLHTTEEFKDKQGKVILKRTYNDDGQYNTYYVYDSYGNLSFVIPPLADDNGTIDTQVQEDLCYLYRYDNKNRLVEKKLPGRQWEFIVYDKLDRPVLTGPALNPFTGSGYGWVFTKYDTFGRPCYTGWYPQTFISGTRYTAQSSYNTTAIDNAIKGGSTIDGKTTAYGSLTVPSGLKLLTVNYYDNYTFPDVLQSIPITIYDQKVTGQVRGLSTGTWIRSLSDANTPVGETTTLLYDIKSRVIRNHKINFLGGTATIDSKYDFTGKVLQQKTTHKRIAQSDPIVVDEDFDYSPQGKPINHIHTINNGTRELLSHNEYDELGSLIQKNVGGTDTNSYAGLQKVDYRYNIRGWLTNINDTDDLDTDPVQDLFAFKISYNNIAGEVPDIDPLYNGNIAETYWRSSGDNILRKYSYRYDSLNRLGDAIYQKPDADIQATHSYDENLTYDKNGNITHLDRNGNLDNLTMNVSIDNLGYSYNGNQLMRVHDNTNSTLGFKDEATAQGGFDTVDDYAYDNNGNMIQDDNKGITSITYNHLNLPIEIIFNSSQNTKINYIYNAAGQKLQKIAKTSATVTRTTDYLDGFQYLNGTLLFFPTAEGYVNNTALEHGNAYNYVYNYLDHLGNIRLSYGLDPSNGELTVLEENHYYPFGLKHTNYNSVLKVYGKEDDGEGIELKPGEPPEGEDPSLAKSLYRYKYQGQERQEELGLNWDSFKYRNYDYAIGRFMSIDPLTEKYTDWTPYAFSGNRVVDSRELEGLEPHSVHSSLAEAGQNFVSQYNGLSIRMKGEVGTKFYSKTVNGEKQYSYIQPVGSPGAGGVDPSAGPENIPEGSDYAGPGHTHKEDLNQIQKDENGKMISNESNTFSEQDLNKTDEQKSNNPTVEGAILGTPNGKALLYTPTGNQGDARKSDITRVSNQMPSDPNSKTRANDVSPNSVPAVLPYGTSQQDVDNLPKL